jgi:hypothetical protein
MKYLYKFNENKDGVPDSLMEIKNLCNDNLVYLIDEGFELEFLIRKNRIGDKVYKTVRILLSKKNGDRTNSIWNKNKFRWDDIKDDFIPSIIMLFEKYKLLEYDNKKYITIKFLKEDKYFSIEDLLEDNIPNSLILNIKFHVFL